MINDLAHACEGDRVTCGKDGKTYRIVGGISYMTSNGKHMAGTLDSFSDCPCRARLIPSVFTATYCNKSTAPYRETENNKTDFSGVTALLNRSKVITRIYLSYGEAQTTIESVSRFYTDLNIHIETSGYLPGETVTVNISGPTIKTLTGTVGANGMALIPNAFANEFIDMEGEA